MNENEFETVTEDVIAVSGEENSGVGEEIEVDGFELVKDGE